ncbi:pyruvate formate lyase family protein [Desulfatibacillum aliphaticivorans]|uniref:pyruvate formate lyase family protein n=1 Tax=Desulfatibacillum aliphaticivorans TaxID=218208 RepID=UPI000416B26D|nr:pyruvate formate lyase family protein [Desulfatibacillum aliphaticivorans]
MAGSNAQVKEHSVKEPKGLSPRIEWLRDYYFQGAERAWNNEYTAWTTGDPWDEVYDELSFYIVPETYAFMQTFCSSYLQAARKVPLNGEFWDLSLPERRAWFVKKVMTKHLPVEILPGDLIAGGRFNIQTSMCLDEKQAKTRKKLVQGKKGSRAEMKWFHDHGYGNAGATSGHLVPGYEDVLKKGWKGVHDDLASRLDALGPENQNSHQANQLKAMMTAATMPRDLAARYASLIRDMEQKESDPDRKEELARMAANLDHTPWNPPRDFWEAIQALWLTHMLVLSDENYPGPGVSFGRVDQYLLPYWEASMARGMDREWGKEILKCFWIHANTAYDAMIRTGANGGITAGYGQLITLSGMGPDGTDLTNDLTYVFLEVIDEMSPILEPKPNVRLHANTPEELYDHIIDMIAESQGAPFLLNFDERSMAGMMREAEKAGRQDLINESNVWQYAPVGCLENTMVGNDRSGTVDINLNLLKAVEFSLTGGADLSPYKDTIMGKEYPIDASGIPTGDPTEFTVFEEFFAAFAKQTRHIIKKAMDLYETSESVRAAYHPTPYLSCLVKGCAEKGKDVTQGGAELSFVTIEAVTFATTVDSLLAVKYLVFDEKICTMAELIQALKDNWKGHDILMARAKFKAPKYGRDDDEADEMARKVMDLWTEETWKYKTKSTGRQARPGMLSWNYWVGDGYILHASPDGRPQGQFLSNAICPTNGADINGPTSNANSVGKVLGGRKPGKGDFGDYLNSLPNGASHTITFNPSILADPLHKEKFKAYLKGYVQNGGTALQINMLDADMLRDAQKNPADYRHLLVRITGYNAYFTSIGKELQDEVIARLSHEGL